MKLIMPVAMMATVALSGCSTFYPPASKHELAANQSYWLNYDASRRGTMIVTGAAKVKSCSEPAPDVALSFANNLKGSASAPTGATAGSGEATLNVTAMALAGRDELVLLAREGLFRVCEANLNGTIADDKVLDAFNSVLKGVVDIATKQAATAASKAATADAEVQKAKLLNK